jgi:tetratricopeptide (TPR) repeat protein
MTEKEDTEVLLKLAHGLFVTKNYDLSLQYYDKIYYLSDNYTIKFQCRLKEISHHLITKEYNKALVVLFSLKTEFYIHYPHIIDFLFAVSYFGLEDYEQSEKHYLNIAASDPEVSAKIRDIFSNKKRFYKPNPNTISTLSLFIPGLGQFLSSEYKEGLNSFILVEGIGVIAVFVALKYSFVDAILSIVPWYQRYLIGGSDKAEKLAIEKRSRNRNEIYLEIIDALKPLSHLLEFNPGQ